MNLPDFRAWVAVSVFALISLASCISAPQGQSPQAAAPLCSGQGVELFVDFPSAGHHECTLDPDGAMRVSVSPELSAGPPINPSPWYAFALNTEKPSDVVIRLDYGTYEHRYHPHLRVEGGFWLRANEGAVEVSPERSEATLHLSLKKGRTTVASQPVLTVEDSLRPLDIATERGDLRRVKYGTSLGGRALYAYEAGAENASNLVVALARQHPPEITGAEAFLKFSQELLRLAPEEFWNNTAVVLLPVVNPDGVEGGNWRLNFGGVDLNRDWFEQTQPETRSIASYIEGRARGRRTIAFLDFHSTWRTLVYSPPFDNASPDAALLPELQGALVAAQCGPAEWIFGHNADRGTSKAWALQQLNAPGITIEFGDNEDRENIDCAARTIAHTVLTYARSVSDLASK